MAWALRFYLTNFEIASHNLMSAISPPVTANSSMTPCSVPQCLSELVQFLDSLEERAPQQELNRLLTELEVSPELLSDFINFSDCTYHRNLITEAKWYELLCICWQSGQRSPIHNHAQSTCGLRIVEGVATETIFEPTASGQIKAVKSSDFSEGFVCTSEDADIHQVSNLQSPGKNLVTLHIYSPPLRTMDTYTLLGSDSVPYSPPQNEKPDCPE